MNTRNILTASVIGAVVTTVLANIPFLVCLACLPHWGGPLLATWIYKRQNGTLPMNDALIVGLVAGVIASVLGSIIGLLWGPMISMTMTNLLQQYWPSGGVPLDAASAGPDMGPLLMGVVFYIIFGLIGGLIGGSLFKDKTTPTAPPVPPSQ